MTDDTVDPDGGAKLRRRMRRVEVSSFWLRGMGLLARPVVYLGPMALIVWWLWPYVELLSQPLDSLILIDFLLVGGCIVGFFGIAIPALLYFLNFDGDEIDWESWGCVGCGLVAALVPLWAALGGGLH